MCVCTILVSTKTAAGPGIRTFQQFFLKEKQENAVSTIFTSTKTNKYIGYIENLFLGGCDFEGSAAIALHSRGAQAAVRVPHRMLD
jgi:hypothetical protein